MATEADGITSLITEGVVDEHLESIRSAVHAREDFLASQKALTMMPGTRVRFSESFRPVYARGIEGEVTENNRGKLKVKTDPGPFKGQGTTWTISSASILEVI